MPFARKREGQAERWVGLPSFLVRSILTGVSVIGLSSTLGSEGLEEFRGLWVIRHSLTTPQQVRDAVETARLGGFNAVLVQVRGRGDAYYRSQIVPRAESLAQVGAAFDPLAFMLKEAHRADIEVHAWVNAYLTWHPSDRLPRSEGHVFRQHPEWFMTSRDGIDMGSEHLGDVDLVSRGVEGRYLSPGIPEVRVHLLQAIHEIVRNYEIDGIHLDYVRYPNRHYDFNIISRAEFVRRHRFDPLPILRFAEENGAHALGERLRIWEEWRSEQVTRFVEGVRHTLDRTKPWLRLSAAVKPDIKEAYHQHGQDWIRWINDQTVDFVVPMYYSGSTSDIASQIEAVRSFVKRGHLYAGLGAYNQSAEKTVAQIKEARRLGLKGVSIYSLDRLLQDPPTLQAISGSFRDPSRPPEMPWKPERGAREAEKR